MAGNVNLDAMSGGSVVATDNVGDVHYQRVKITTGNSGTADGDVYSGNPLPITSIGGTINAGTVAVNTPGTITSGSISVIAGTIGTVANVAQVHNAGTLAAGDNNIGNVDIVTGTVTSVGTVANVGVIHNAGTVASVQQVVTGTIANSGTTTGVGTISNIAVVHNAGTLAAGGNNIGDVDIVTGTITSVTAVANLTNGTVRVTAGTVNSGTINAGTINTGTINAGTINAGTVKIHPRSSTNLFTIGSIWGTTSGTAGTIVASPGASNVIYVDQLSITNEGTSTLTAGMGFGTNQQGTVVLARVAMAGNGGIQKSFPHAVGGLHPNLPLVIWTTGSGTASFQVTYGTEAQ